MGFYIRKALSVGPLRFNLSKSGVGVSAGIRGLRFGTGPRGNYVHMGRGGFYFRKTLASGQRSPLPVPRQETARPGREVGFAELLKDIESGSALDMTDSSAAELLEELNSKRRLTPFLPFAVALAVILVLSAVLAVIRGGSWWISALLAVAGVSLPIIASFRDQLRKTVVVFYELEGDAEEGYQRLHDAFDSLTACSRAWHVEAAGSVGQRKYHAGATTAVRRQPITVARRAIPYLKTNVDIPTIPVGKQLLAFMPERLLVVDSTACGAVPYSELLLDVAQTRFVEDGAVAGDAQVVDQTWKYVNKKGGPDRRFKDNRQLPVVLYDELHFSSSSGLNEIIQLSRCDVGAPFKAAVLGLARSAKAV